MLDDNNKDVQMKIFNMGVNKMAVNYKELEGTIFRREFLNIRPDFDLQIRLIGTPVQFFRVFTQDKRCVMVDDEETAKYLL